jgi:hypothetical protein
MEDTDNELMQVLYSIMMNAGKILTLSMEYDES